MKTSNEILEEMRATLAHHESEAAKLRAGIAAMGTDLPNGGTRFVFSGVKIDGITQENAPEVVASFLCRILEAESAAEGGT